MAGEVTPALQQGSLVRSQDIVQLADQVVLDANVTAHNTAPVATGGFRHFALYLRLKSASTPTDLRIIVQFYDEVRNLWHTYKQGLFAALYYEDQDLATEQDEMFSGDCAGRLMRIRLVATGTTATATFTASASVEFWT